MCTEDLASRALGDVAAAEESFADIAGSDNAMPALPAASECVKDAHADILGHADRVAGLIIGTSLVHPYIEVERGRKRAGS